MKSLIRRLCQAFTRLAASHGVPPMHSDPTFRTVEVPPNLDRLFGSTPHEGELKQLYAKMPKDHHYALQYPDGTYAVESNCQGWGSTNKKPKIGDQWCFDAQHAIWALRDLRGCRLIRITE